MFHLLLNGKYKSVFDISSKNNKPKKSPFDFFERTFFFWVDDRITIGSLTLLKHYESRFN